MDRERRASTLIALHRSPPAIPAGRILVSLAVALLVLSVSGCRSSKEVARQRVAMTEALGRYRAHIEELQKQASALRARFGRLPEDLPGLGPVRDDLHAIEEVLGVEDGRTKWLAGELDKAFASGKAEDIAAASTAIPQGDEATAQAIVKLAHALVPLERLAAQRRFFESLDAANAHDAGKARQPKTQ